MCGIAGFLTRARFDREGALNRMSSLLAHRGPDDEGRLMDQENGVYLAHRRLAIIDLSPAGRQPLQSEDRSISVVVNGEFYNYREVRSLLEKRGHRFSSTGDSEIAVHGYEEWGMGILKRLEGMYALAIWDARSNQLILARDPLGIKPLVYLQRPEGLFFASEARAFHALPRSIFDPRFDRSSLGELLCFQYLYHPERTAYEGVSRVPPGACIVYRNGRINKQVFWEIAGNEEYSGLDFETALPLLEGTLRRAVRSHLVADVPVGVLLSGGLDSSVVAALAQQSSSRPVATFTAGFDHRLDERPYARQVAEHLGTEHHDFTIEPRRINDRLEELVGHLDDLTSLDGGMFTVFLIGEQVKSLGVKVLLVGEGSDEIFGGYSWFGLSQRPFCWFPGPLRSLIYYYAVSRMLPGIRSLRHACEISRIIARFQEEDIFKQVSRFEITRQLPNHFLMKVDHGTMAHGLEARVPYLDRALVELVYSLPARLKLAGEWFSFRAPREKFILKALSSRHLPRNIAQRKKRGFSIPMPEVLKSNRDKLRSYLLDPTSLARQFFSRDHLDKLLNFGSRMYSPVHKHREFLCWRLFLLELWRRHYGVSL